MFETVFTFLWLALMGWIFNWTYTPGNLVLMACAVIVLDIVKDWAVRRFAP